MQKDKFDMMTRRPVKPLICSMAVPTIVSMLVTSLYNMADTFFVGKINTQATAAVGVAFPLMAVVQAFGFFFGHGSGNYISRRLGARDPGAAGRMAATGFVSAFLCGLLVAVAGLLCLDGLCVALGSTPTVLPYTRQYVGVVLLGAPFLASSLVLNNQLRFQGNASVAMGGIVAGAAVNVGLGPLFIFTLDMGVAGAAWATVASQAVSFLFLFVLDRRLSAVPIRLRLFTPRVALFSEIVRGGSPSLARQGLACTATLLLNFMAGRYGDAAIAGMSIATRVSSFLFSFLLGFGQGFQPVCGFNYGARLYGRVLEGLWFCVKVGTAFLLVCAVAGLLWAPEVVRLFRHDPAVIAVGAAALRWQVLAFPLSAFVTVSNMMLQTIRKSTRAVILSSARQGLFFIPLIFLLPAWFGLAGVEAAQAVADVCSFFLAVPLVAGVLRELRRGDAPGGRG